MLLEREFACRYCREIFGDERSRWRHSVFCNLNPDPACPWCGLHYGKQVLCLHEQKCPERPQETLPLRAYSLPFATPKDVAETLIGLLHEAGIRAFRLPEGPGDTAYYDIYVERARKQKAAGIWRRKKHADAARILLNSRTVVRVPWGFERFVLTEMRRAAPRC
ncbi:MAG TPA: hypothetical protein VM681_00215 [Candidatus Thermoplasmatota archaeon]|nr:hypothetical protein [Candidatus Thermoplasmatota archaeon]